MIRHALLAAAFGTLIWAPALEAQSLSTFQATRQLHDETDLQVEVNFGAGTIRVSPLQSAQLYRLLLRFDEEAVEPIHSYDNGVLRIGARGVSTRRILRRSEGDTDLDLRLGTGVPIDLRMELGAVRSNMELGGIPLRALELTVGASDSNVSVSTPNPVEMDRARIQVGAAAFNGRGLGHLRASSIDIDAGVGDVRLDLAGLSRDDTRLGISMGLGNVELRVPRGIGIRLDRSTFLTAVNAPDLTRDGNSYYSPEWDGAGTRLRIRLDAAIGNVSITRYDP
jgi:hypothetical protein